MNIFGLRKSKEIIMTNNDIAITGIDNIYVTFM